MNAGCVQVKLWDRLRTRAIPEHLRGVFTTRRYTNPRLPYLTIQYSQYPSHTNDFRIRSWETGTNSRGTVMSLCTMAISSTRSEVLWSRHVSCLTSPESRLTGVLFNWSTTAVYRAVRIELFMARVWSTLWSFLLSTRLLLKVAITYRVNQNESTSGSSFSLVVQQEVDTSHNVPEEIKRSSKASTRKIHT